MTSPRRLRRSLPAIVAPPDIDAAAFDGEVTTPSPRVILGRAGNGDEVSIDLGALLATRMLIQGMSGAGKSWALRRLLEVTRSHVPQVVIDPEGEFREMAESFGHVGLDAARLDTEALEQAALQSRRARASLWVDLSQCARGTQLTAVAAVLNGLIAAGRDHWHATLVAVDEAHLFAPSGAAGGPDKRSRTESLAAMVDLMSRGRKRGLCAVLVTQRLGAMARSIASEAGNVMLGLTVQDIDIARGAAAVGWPARKADGVLRFLRPGHFVAFGPAFAHQAPEVRIGPVSTRHIGASPRLAPPIAAADEPAGGVDVDGLVQASASRLAALRKGGSTTDATAVRRFAREPGAVAAVRAYEELHHIRPLGRGIDGLARRLELDTRALEQGLMLLEDLGLVRRGRSHDGPTVEAL